MSNRTTEHRSVFLRHAAQWLVGNAKNKRTWLLVSTILMAFSLSLFSSPTRVLAGKQLLQQAWTTVASVTGLEQIPRTLSKPQATTKLMTVASKNPILNTVSLNIARQGHAAIRLSNGRILIVGGENANGLIKESEIYDPVTHRSLLADNLNTARTEHTATALPDGRILIVGGRGQAQPLRTTEIYDVNSNVFRNGPSLNRPRAGHSATALADGRILIAGGSADGSAEIFDPASQTFSLVAGGLNVARSLHSAVTLKNGKVLLAGGKLANGKALNAAEIFNPATQQFAATTTTMRGARISPALNLLPDGKVQVIGGGEETMEMYNAGGNYFTAYAHLSANDATLSTPGRAALFHRKNRKASVSPAQTESFTREAVAEADPTSDPTDRDASTSTDTGTQTLIAGGVDSTDTTLASAVEMTSSTASITTDKTDYSPGEIVTIIGSGWQAGEIVQLTLHRDNDTPDTILLGTAGQDGNFTNSEYLVQDSDLRVAFVLTAVGQTSGSVALTLFTDAHSVSSVVPNSGTTTGGTAVTINGSGFNQNNAGISFTYSVTFGTTTVSATRTSNNVLTAITPAHAVGVVNVTVNQIPSSGLTTTATLVNGFTYTGTIATTTSINAPTITYGSNGSVTVTVTSGSGTPTGNISLSVDSGGAITQALSSGSSIFTLSGLSAGSHSLTANYAAQAGFGASTASGSIQVNQKALTGSITAQSKTYDGNTTATILTRTLTGVVGADDVSYTGGTATFDTKNVGTGKTVTATGLSLIGTAASNYTVNSTATTTANITARSLTVSATASNKVYDGTTAATVSLSDNRVSGDTLTVASTNATFANKNVGTGKLVTVSGISISGADAGNYTVNTSATTTADITTKSITVTAVTDSKTYDGTTASGGTPTIAPGLASGDTASFTQAFDSGNVGARTLTPSGSVSDGNGGNNYAVTFANVSGSITARPLTVTADARNKTYGDADPTLTYQVTSGSLVSGDSLSGNLTRVTGESVGGYAIQQGTLTAGSNYMLTYVGANLTISARAITVTADAKNKTYGDADPALTYQITSGSLAFTDTFSGALTRAAGEGVGTYAILQGTLALGTNYSLSYVGANLTIGQRAVTVTADAQTKVYGNADPSLTYQITSGSLAFSDAFTGALTRAVGEGIGNYAIQQGTLALNGNYALTYVGANLTITARPITVTADAKSKTYGDADPALTYQITSGALAFSDAFTGSLTRVSGESANTYAIQQGTLALNSNYMLTYVGANLTISARAITVTADAKNKTYGDADPALTYQITSGSLAFTDVFTGALTRGAGENIGAYAITQDTLALNGNYALAYVGANLTITKRGLTLTAQTNTKTYDGITSVAAVPMVSGLQFSDTVSGLTETYDNRNTGTGKTLSVATYTVNDGNGGNNYTVTTATDTTGVINKAPLTITALTNTKVYDAAASAIATPTTNGLQGSDTVTSLSETYDNRHVGTGKTLSVTGYTVNDGNGGNNYTVTTVPNVTGVISKAPLTITALTNTKVFDGTINAAAIPSVSGLQGSDTVSGLSETYNNQYVGTGKTLSVASYMVNDGNGGNNYNVSTATNPTGVITAAGTAVTSVTVTPGTQQYSDKVDLSATTASSPGIGGSVSFYINGTSALQLLGTVSVVPNGTASLTGVALLETVAGSMSPGTHTVKAVFTPSDTLNYSASNNTASLTITQEDATATYSGPAYFATSSPTSTTAAVTLSATVVDAADGARGDIRKATVEFRRDSPAGALLGSANVGLVNTADLTVGTATTTFSYTLSGSEANSNGVALNVYVVIKGYYTYADTQPTVVTVTIPGTDSVNGGGHLVLTSSNGQYAGLTGSKMNFGFTMKYNNSGKNLQGQANIIIRANDGKVYQVKGNAIDSLAVSGTTYPKGGTFVTKANLTDITNPLAPIAIGGNLKLQVEMTDAALGGQTDKVGITLWNSAGGLFFSSNWTGTTSIQQLLGGGNISVR